MLDMQQIAPKGRNVIARGDLKNIECRTRNEEYRYSDCRLVKIIYVLFARQSRICDLIKKDQKIKAILKFV